MVTDSLNNANVEKINALLDGALTMKDFTVEHLPGVVQDFYTWELFLGITFLICSVIIVFTFIKQKNFFEDI